MTGLKGKMNMTALKQIIPLTERSAYQGTECKQMNRERARILKGARRRDVLPFKSPLHIT